MNCDIVILKSDVKEVSSIAVVHDGKILMGKRSDNNRWTLPGGHLEGDESPIDGAIRELFEEAGIKVSPKKLKHLDSKKVSSHTGKKMEIHAYKYEWNGEKPTSKNDPDEEVAKWEWIDMKLPEDVKSNLHSPKNVALRALGVLKGGVGSGVRGHHTDPWRNPDVAGESSKPMSHPDDEHEWDMAGLITDKRDKDRSLFYVSPKRKLKNRIEDDKIKRIEEESWKRLMQKKSFHFFIDLLKAAGHKYLRKYKKGDKWIYIYYEPQQRPRKLEDEAFKILKRMAELGHEGAKKLVENAEDHTAQIEMSMQRIKDLIRDRSARQVHLDHLKNEYGLDKEAEELEQKLIPAVVKKPVVKDTIDKPLDEGNQNLLNNQIKLSVGMMWDRFRSNPNSAFENKLREAGVTNETIMAGLEGKTSIRAAMSQLHENLKAIDTAHEGAGTPQYDWAKRAGGYANAIYNETIKKLEAEGMLPRGYGQAHKRTGPQDLEMPKASDLERIQREQAEAEERRREEERRAEAERRAREEEEMRRAFAELDGSMAFHMVSLMTGSMSMEEKKRTAVNLDREIKNIFGRRLTKEEFPYTFEGMKTEIRSVSIRSGEIFLEMKARDNDGKEITDRWQRYFRKKDGRPNIYNDYLIVNSNARNGARIGEKVNEAQRKLMRSMPDGGTVEVTAALSVGPYMWANTGFSFKHEDDISSYRRSFKSFLAERGVYFTDEEMKLFKEPCHFANFTNGTKKIRNLDRAIPLSKSQKETGSLTGVAGEHPLTPQEMSSGEVSRMAVHLGKEFMLRQGGWSGIWDSKKETVATKFAEAYPQLKEHAINTLGDDYVGLIDRAKAGTPAPAPAARPERTESGTSSGASPPSSSSTTRSELLIRRWSRYNHNTGRRSMRQTPQRISEIARMSEADFEHFMRHAPISRGFRNALREARRSVNRDDIPF